MVWQNMRGVLVSALLIVLTAYFAPALAEARPDIGVVILHGKWDSPNGHTSGLAGYLEREGFRTNSPEMPWAGSRAYDSGVDRMIADVDKAVANLRAAGAKKVYIAGHSQGAAGALYYAGRNAVDGIILIATGGHAQGKTFATHYAPFVTEAQTLVGQGKGAESVSFVDLNTGGRNRRLRAPAQSIVDYFYTEGPFNTYRSAAQVRPGVAVLIVVPTNESDNLKRLAHAIRDKFPAGVNARLIDVDADHLSAPDAAKSAIRDWLLAQ